MNRNMRFRNGQNACDALGAEVVKRLSDDCGANVMRGRQHRLTYVIEVVQQCGVTFPQFEQNVTT